MPCLSTSSGSRVINLDELLNHDIQSNAHGRPTTPGELIDEVGPHLRSSQKQPHIVKRFFQEEHVAYTA